MNNNHDLPQAADCWVMTEGLTGTQNQCLALAEACGFAEPVIKTVKLRVPWRWVTPYIRRFSLQALADGSSLLQAPWPALIIASGRKAIAAALWVKLQSGGRAVLVIVQSPIIQDRQFDLVVAPRHDAYAAPNAMAIAGALSVVSSDRLTASRAAFPLLAGLPQPRIAVLIGGNSRTHRLTPAIADALTLALQALQRQGYGLMITASRRTPATLAERMRQDLRLPHVDFWDGSGANPFQAYLAYSDIILVTEDSVSMASEAISTGKPVYIIKLAGGSARFRRFHDHLIRQRYARWFEGRVESWIYTPPTDLADAAARVKMLLQTKDA